MDYPSKRVRLHQIANEQPNSLLSLVSKLPPAEISKFFHMALKGTQTSDDCEFWSTLSSIGDAREMKLPQSAQAPDIPIPDDPVSHCFSFIHISGIPACASVNRRWYHVSRMVASYRMLEINRCKLKDQDFMNEYCERFSKIKLLIFHDREGPGCIEYFSEYLTKTKSLHTLRFISTVYSCDIALMRQNYATLQVLEAEFPVMEYLHELPNLKLVKIIAGSSRHTSDAIGNDPCPRIQALGIRDRSVVNIQIDVFLAKFPNIRFLSVSQNTFKFNQISKLSSLPKLEFLGFRAQWPDAARKMILEGLCKRSTKLSHVQIHTHSAQVPGTVTVMNTHGFGVISENLLSKRRYDQYSPRDFGIMLGYNIHISLDKFGNAVFKRVLKSSKDNYKHLRTYY